MSRNEFENIFPFLHCCNNSEYATRGWPGYNPKKKLGFTYEKLVKIFCNIWSPYKNIAIDEGTAPSKGRIHLKCYDPNKLDKDPWPLKYVTHLIHTTVCYIYMLGKLMMVQKLLNLGKHMT